MIKKKTTKTIERKELYDLVWSKPIMELSKEFGVSDRGLGKVCERYDIPKPPRGYWQKLEAGERIKIPKLPKNTNPWKETVRMEGSFEVELSSSVSEKIAEQTSKRIVIPERCLKSNPLVKETEKSVRKELRHRRSLLLNSLFSELKNNEYEIELEEDCFKISLGKEKIYLKIAEQMKEQKRPLTEKEEKNKIYGMQKWVYEYEPTGRLKISLLKELYRYSSGLISYYADSKATLVEEKINDIYFVIVEWIFNKREERLKKEEKEKLRQEREKQERIKKKKQEILLEETKGFILAKNIREYVYSKEKTFKDNKVKMLNFEEWKSFALNHADEIDPSFKDEEEVVDNYKPYNWY